VDVRDLVTYAAGPLVVALVVAVMAVTAQRAEEGSRATGTSQPTAIGNSEPTYDAVTNVRIAIPAVEAYNADNEGYTGMTVRKLRAYDSTLQPIVIVRATQREYCIENPVGPGAHKNGPGADIQPGLCPR
jgi:hypothetical protein